MLFLCISEVEYAVKNIITEKNLIRIIQHYLYEDSKLFYDHYLVESNYIPYILTLYINLLSGFDLFDNQDNELQCLMARTYAIEYLSKYGLKATWECKEIRCNLDNDSENIMSNYPLNSYDGLTPYPYYKCKSCNLKSWGLVSTEDHEDYEDENFNVWYLHFEW